jgi:hypothetical protein
VQKVYREQTCLWTGFDVHPKAGSKEVKAKLRSMITALSHQFGVDARVFAGMSAWRLKNNETVHFRFPNSSFLFTELTPEAINEALTFLRI